jgi:hypothetical protein
VSVGATHWRELEPAPGATRFFAPEEMRRRRAEWGAAGFDARFTAAFGLLLDWSRSWLRTREVHGPDEALDAYRAVARGDADPGEGFIVRLTPHSSSTGRSPHARSGEP